MKRKLSFLLTVLFLISVLPAGLLFAETSNSIINLTGAKAGYSIAILADPEKIPVLVIQPQSGTRLQGISFELRLTNAYWDFEAYSRMGIDNYGDVNKDGEFIPVNSKDGYLTGGQWPQGLSYVMSPGGRDNVAVITLDPYTVVSSYEALYIPMLVEVTGSPASVEIYDPASSGLSSGGAYTFASGGLGGSIITQVKPGESKSFSQTVVLEDIVIQELEPGALVDGTLALVAPAGYSWINIDQIQLAGRKTSGLAIKDRYYAVEGPNAKENQASIKLDIAMNKDGSGEPRALILKNLQLSAAADNTAYGPVAVTLSGCNMERETVRVANRIKVDYTVTAADEALPKLIAGYEPADAVSESLKTLKVTLEESAAGRWWADGRTTFTLPEGITAKAVRVTTTNFAVDLPQDTLIRRIDENAYGLNTENSGSWTLAANGLTIRNAVVKKDLKAKVELTFYITADESYSGPVFLTAGGSGLSHEAAVAIAEVVAKPAGMIAVELTIGSTELKIGDEKVTMDVAPYIKEDYTMVPVSYVAKALGLPEGSVEWDGQAGTVKIDNDGKSVLLTIDSKVMTVDGQASEIAAAPAIREGRTFLPFRVLGEQILGVTVGWDADKGIASFLPTSF
ncbi:MAG: copper amine oxidase N-terminal domain-containing protein [Clostridiales bacterium]